MTGLAPGFLISMPQLHDEYFEKAVVLMINHSAEGAMGLVITRQAQVTYEELASDHEIELPPERGSKHIFVGGPVEPYRGFVLHDSPTVAEKTEVLPGVFLSVTNDSLGPLLADPSINVLFCLGCSNWGAGQLESEIKRGSWLFTEASAQPIFGLEPAKVWERTIQSMGVDPAMLVTTGGVN